MSADHRRIFAFSGILKPQPGGTATKNAPATAATSGNASRITKCGGPGPSAEMQTAAAIVGTSANLLIVAAGDLPDPPDLASMEAWAGPGRVIRASASDVAGWQLPRQQKAALTSCGVPLLEGIVDLTMFAAEPHDGRYRLAGTKAGLHHPGFAYSAEPQTGLVTELEPSSGHVRFVNSSINHWLCSLHMVGTWLSNSMAIQTWDEDKAMEDVALAELADLSRQITHLDPPAYGNAGDHQTHFWPATLDRWLY